MRRIVNTHYISKITGDPTGVWCTQFSVDNIKKMSIEELYTVAKKERLPSAFDSAPVKSKKAQRNFVEFVCDMLEVGGIVFTAAPSNKKNHGFWKFCPTAFTDGFLQNGFEIVDIVGIKPKELGFNKPNPEDRKINYFYKDMRQEAALAEIDDNVIMCVAKKVKNIYFKWPLQMIYAKNYSTN